MYDCLKKTRLRRPFQTRVRSDHSIASDERGSTVVEFALVAPMFFFMMFVIAQNALIFIAEQVLDNAVFEATRLIRTGQAQTGEFDAAAFRTEVCNRASVFIDCTGDRFYLDVRSAETFEEFAGLSLPEPLDDDDEMKDDDQYDAGGPSSIVIVRAYYVWPTADIFNGYSFSNAGTGKRLIGSFAAFRNEPFVEESET